MNKLHSLTWKNVKIKDAFWSERQKINIDKTIPYQYQQLLSVGHIDALKYENPKDKGIEIHPFWDSDVAKWIEAASYVLAVNYNEELDKLVDETIGLLEKNQLSDGYLNTYFSKESTRDRWTDLRDAHELYCAGHLIEAGVAHFKGTGKKTLLNIVCKYADYINDVFGYEEQKLKGYPGHQEIELALFKLFEVTNNKKYLELCRFFIDERGREPHYFDYESKKYGPGYFDELFKTFPDLKEYNQSHLPVRAQDTAVGHSVRALYMYCAMVDLANEVSDVELLNACKNIWNNLYNKKKYVTGGLGSTHLYEGFTENYDLPNETSYAETCAAIASVFWNHRMVNTECDSRYADELERALYNGVISGVSLDGEKYFYDNPLSSNGDKQRSPWFGVACCPPNISRLIASLGEYIYSVADNEIIAHLYIQSDAEFNLVNNKVKVNQITNFPWDNKSKFNIDVDKPTNFKFKLRKPYWARDVKVKVNNKEIINLEIDRGYITIDRLWDHEDFVEIEFLMEVERVYSNPNVRQNRGKISLQYGPFIYCFEGIDNVEDLQTVSLVKGTNFYTKYEKDLLGGIMTISGNGMIYKENNEALYKYEPYKFKETSLKAIPYFSWNNRGVSSMRVWINETNDNE